MNTVAIVAIVAMFLIALLVQSVHFQGPVLMELPEPQAEVILQIERPAVVELGLSLPDRNPWR